MILLDPGLTSRTVRKPNSARRSAIAGPRRAADELRLPSPRTLARFLALAQAAVRLRGQVSVLLTTDAEIRRLNRSYRGIDKTTDVLSFPAADSPAGPERLAGDLAISVPTAHRQATEQGHPLLTEIKVLILHGLLHLAGYDHETDGGAMARRERLLRGRLKLPQGLIERAENHPGSSPKRPRKPAAPAKAARPAKAVKKSTERRS